MQYELESEGGREAADLSGKASAAFGEALEGIREILSVNRWVSSGHRQPEDREWNRNRSHAIELTQTAQVPPGYKFLL